MREAPKDGTPVRLRLEYPEGPRELPGAWAWRKLGTWPPRWVRCSDAVELFIAPCDFRLVDAPARAVLL